MIPKDAALTPHPDVLGTNLENGEAVLLHMSTKSYYSLNETGSRIWDLINQRLTVCEISSGIADEFDVDPESAKESVIQLASQLVEENLLLLNAND